MLSSHRPTYNESSAPLAPSPGISCPSQNRNDDAIGRNPDLTSTLHALQVTQHVLEMFRRTLSDQQRFFACTRSSWPTASPKSLPNFANSPPNRSGQKLAG